MTWDLAASSGTSRRAWCWQVRGLPSYSEAHEAAACGDRAGVHSHTSLNGGFEKYFVFPQLQSAHLEILCIFSFFVSSYLAVFVLCLGVVEEYSIGLFGRFSSCAMLGSTVDTCSASVLGAFGRLYIFSTGKWTQILKCFFSVLLQNGEVCSVEASVFSLVTHSSHLEPGQYF